LIGQADPLLDFERIAAGFQSCSILEAEHLRVDLDARSSLADGALDKHVTSQLSVLTEDEYQAGIERISAQLRPPGADRDTELRLRGDLKLFALVATSP
jgi:hypothetical protein